MTNSFARKVQFTCPHDEHKFSAEAWRVVDVGERPDLLEAAHDGSIHAPACPRCNRRYCTISDSLLLFFPGRKRPFIFVPTPGMSDFASTTELRTLLRKFANSIGKKWKDKWTRGGIPCISRENLKAHLDWYRAQGEGSKLRLSSSMQSLFEEAILRKQQFERAPTNFHQDESIRAWEALLQEPDFSKLPARNQASMYLTTAEQYRKRYEPSGNETDFSRSYDLLQAGLALGETDVAPGLACTLGLLTQNHAQRTRDYSEWKAAHTILRSGLRKARPDDPARTALYANIGHVSMDLFRFTRKKRQLDRAIAAYRIAVRMADPISEIANRTRNALGRALNNRFARTGHMKDLDETVNVLTAAIQYNRNTKYLADSWDGRGRALLDQYYYTGDRQKLVDAFKDFEAALTPDPDDHADALAFLIDLGNAYQAKYELDGDVRDFGLSLKQFQRALKRARQGQENPSAALYALATAQHMLCNRTGKLRDLDDTINTFEEAVASTLPRPYQAGFARAGLGQALGERFDRTGQIADLNRAVEVLSEAVQEVDPADLTRGTTLTHYAGALVRKFQNGRNPDDLQLAIEAAEEAYELALHSPLESVATTVDVLSLALLEKYQVTKDLNDLRRAITLLETGIGSLPETSSRRILLGGKLADALATQWSKEHDQTALERAIKLYRFAALEGLQTSAAGAVKFAMDWAAWAFQRESWPEADEAYGIAQASIERVVRLQLLRSEKEAWLSQTQGIAGRAAFTAARTGDFGRAVLALERGSAVLLTEALGPQIGNRARLENAGHAELVEQYERAFQEWRAASRRLETTVGPEHNNLQIAQQARDALDHAVQAIEQTLGTDVDDITTALLLTTPAQSGGPVVYLATTTAGTLALVVTGSAIEAVWPQLNEGQLRSLLVKLDGNRIVGGFLPAQFYHPEWMEQSLEDVFCVLRTSLLEPLLTRLHDLGASSFSLIPYGLLSLLPIPALVDDFTIRIEANIRALAACLEKRQHIDIRSRLLGIGNPLPNDRPLPAAEMEPLAIRRFFGECAADVFTCEHATVDAVVDHMDKASCLHFACHGVSRLFDPMSSGLQLSGGRELSVRDLLYGTATPKQARLAVLSACQSAIPDSQRLPDEMVGLPITLMQAGVPGVIGTLWSVDDISTFLLMQHFYESYFNPKDTPLSIEQALQASQKWLRTVTAKALADHFFDQCRSSDLPYAWSSSMWRRFAAMLPDCVPYQAPIYWAAFLFYGA
jgi:CHAT domain-containing protein